MSQNLKEWIKDIVIAVLIAAVVLFFVKPTIVREHSMEDTLYENDYLFVSRRSYTMFGSPQRGDIIVFKSELTSSTGRNKLLVKRIIAVPGDTIEIRAGEVILNGQVLHEDYIKNGVMTGDMPEVSIPEGKLFVMGDNRENSADSRRASVGLVDLDTVLGKAVLRLFPFSKFGPVR